MKLKIYRGTGQIGGNVIEIATDDGKTKILLDCGKNLPPLDDENTPEDIRFNELTHGTNDYRAVFVTHHHADHCGLIEQMGSIPIYTSRETEGVLNVIADFLDKPAVTIEKDNILKPGRKVKVGDISVLPISVSHSAQGAMMFLVEADNKKLLYTGDFRQIDWRGRAILKEHEIDAMLCEGTNISASIGMTEEYIETKATEIMDINKTSGNVLVLCSSTNIDRIKSIENACIKSGRILAIDPFAKAILDRLGYSLKVDWVGFVPYGITPNKWPRAHRYFMSNIGFFSGGKSMASIAKQKKLVIMVRQTESM